MKFWTILPRSEKWSEYVSAVAKEYNTYEDNIKPLLDYPEDFEW